MPSGNKRPFGRNRLVPGERVRDELNANCSAISPHRCFSIVLLVVGINHDWQFAVGLAHKLEVTVLCL